MNEPDWLVFHSDKVYLRNARNLVLRILVVAFAAALLWHMVIAQQVP
ncbi:MAG TPA: hypothetical protein VGG61_16995 [Gemmataceae bacterium]|jgi:hypothetical protein